MKQVFIVLLSIIVTNLSCVAAETKKQVFIVGVVPQFDARKLHAIWRPILDQVEQETGFRFKLRGSSTIPLFEREFVSGKFDFAYMNPYHLIVANKKAGYVPIVRDRGRKLFGVLVVRKDSNISNPADLNNKPVAFPAPNALGASLQMRQELFDKFGIKVQPRYVKTHDSVYLNVLLGEVMAGGGVQKTLNRQKTEYRDALKIIHTTQKVSPHPLVVLPSVPVQVRQRVQKAFLKLGKSEKGRALLAKIPMKQVGVADMKDYEGLRKMGLERFYVAPK